MQHLIGSGGFAEVWAAVSEADDTVCAVKCTNVSRFDAFMQRQQSSVTLEDEARILERLHHTNIVQLLDWFQWGSRFCTVIQFVEGRNLKIDIIENLAFTEEQAKHLFRQVLSAVGYVHHMQIAHRDVKPENILLCSSSRDSMIPKLCDFGLSRYVLPGGSCRTVCGSPGYMAPEIVVISKRCNPTSIPGYNARVDLWSLGVTLCVLLWAEEPVGQTSVFDNMISGRVQFDKEATWSNIQDIANPIVQRLLCNDPGERMSAVDVVESLDIVLPRDSHARSAKRLRVDTPFYDF